jgi:hypothetical protein
MKLKLQWLAEGIGRGTDRIFDAALTQITSSSLISHNIYCEERYTSADGRYLTFLRSALGQAQEELWLHETKTAMVARLSGPVYGYPASNIYSDALYYVRAGDSSQRVLVRVDLKNLEQEEVFDLAVCPPTRYPVATVSRDDRYYVGKFHMGNDRWGLYRIDLQRGGWEVFHEKKGICNPHQQFEPARSEDILVQWNRGSHVDDEENVIKWGSDEGTTLYVIDRDGNNFRQLPIGTPWTARPTGHECWVGDTGQVLLTTHGANRGELHLATPGAEKSRVLWTGVAFDHISVSADGRFWVTDDLDNGLIYVGCLETGRMLPLCDAGVSFGHPQYSHPHAYMTPDNKRVIFNSDRTNLCQVWCADVPPGFLEALAWES